MLKWFLSPKGEKMEVQEVLERNLLAEFYPKPYLVECAKERMWKGRASTTQLLNGTRLEYLKILTPYAIDPDAQSFRIIGTRGHGKLELNVDKDALAEFDLSEDEITGILDLYEEIDGEGVITDYKVWGSYKVGLALGLEKKQRPAFDNEGIPIVYQKSGKWGKAGDQKMEDYYVENPDKTNIPETELQINRYRNALEKVLKKPISKMKLFIPVRDGNTRVAKSNGVTRNTYYISVKELDPDFVKDYFNKKKIALLKALDNYEVEFSKKTKSAFDLVKTIQSDSFVPDYDLVEKCAPPVCSNVENWDGRRCQGYCPVSDICGKIESFRASEIKAIDPDQKQLLSDEPDNERFKYLEIGK